MEGSNLFYALLGGFSFSLERICLQCERPGFDPWVGRISWKRERLPTPIFWPREFHGLVHGSERRTHPFECRVPKNSKER